MNLRNKLSQRLTMDEAREIVLSAKIDDSIKEELYNLIFDEDLAPKALWIMTHYASQENKWLYSKQDKFIDEVLITKDPSKHRLLLTLLYKQPLTNPPRVDFLDYCLEKMVSTKEPPATIVLCMKLAYEMCRTIPELKQEYQAIVDTLETSMLSTWGLITLKKIKKVLSKGKSLQHL